MMNPVSLDFADRLNRVINSRMTIAENNPRDERRLTPHGLYEVIARDYPGLRLSRSNLYRLAAGTGTPPRLDIVIALAEILDVPPQYFLPGSNAAINV